MSYREAKADGVRVGKHGVQTVYFPPCMFCGDEVFSYNYLRNRKYTCTACRPHKTILLATGLYDDKRERLGNDN